MLGDVQVSKSFVFEADSVLQQSQSFVQHTALQALELNRVKPEALCRQRSVNGLAEAESRHQHSLCPPASLSLDASQACCASYRSTSPSLRLPTIP